LQYVLAARILTVDFVVCTLAVKKKIRAVSICRIGPFPSVDIAKSYGLEGRGSIPGRRKFV
jgi:hypothetical protein